MAPRELPVWTMTNFQLDSTELQWLTRLARALLRERHAADDLVQDTVVAALEGTPPHGPARRSWLAGVSRRLAARRLRSDTRRQRRETARTAYDPPPETADLVARAEVAEKLAEAARQLPEPYRRTILLRFLESRTTKEIAALDDMREDTVRFRVRRGLELLRQQLEHNTGENWDSLSVHLLPLAASREGIGLAATASPATAGTLATWIAMNSKLLALTTVTVALIGTVCWSLSDPSSRDDAPKTASIVNLAPVPNEAAAATPLTASLEPPQARSRAAELRPAAAPTPDEQLTGLVVDEAGLAIADAMVCAFPDSGGDEPLVRSTTNARGEFRLQRPDAAIQLAAFANGYRRAFVADAHANADASAGGNPELRIVLERGLVMSGRVVDAFGRNVPNLPLIAHTANSGVAHVSPTQMQLRADRRLFERDRRDYEHCRARTDDNGAVTFSGLAPGSVTVRSVAPDWTIEGPAKELADGTHTWTATRRLGVELTVVDTKSQRPIDDAQANFRVELTLADGTTRNEGQWVGRGRGRVSFVLGPETLPPLGDQAIIRAVFYGEAGNQHGRKPWRAEPINGPMGAVGVARVRVEIETDTSSAGSTPKPLPQTTVELIVAHPDGTPFDGNVFVKWFAENEQGQPIKGRARPTAASPGRFLVPAPAGKVQLVVQERFASGSIAPWRGEVFGYADRIVVARVTLPRTARVSLVRPKSFEGDWHVHASYRESDDEDWFGSWNYGTDGEELQLNALRPAEWRFQLRQETDSEPIIRTVLVQPGDRLRVDR